MKTWKSRVFLVAEGVDQGLHAGVALVVAGGDLLVEGRLEGLGEGDRLVDAGVELAGEVGVDLHDEVLDAGAGDLGAVEGGVAAVPDIPHADDVLHHVAVGVVGEAGVLVFLVAAVEGSLEALAAGLEAGEHDHAREDALDGGLRSQAGPVGAVAFGRVPGGVEALEVAHEDVADEGQVELAAVGVRGRAGARDVEVLPGTGSRAVGAHVLAPEQELDGVVAGRHVGLAADLVEGEQGRGVERDAAVVDDARGVVALDVVDVVLVEGPGVHGALGAVVGVVDGAVVEAVDLGHQVGLAAVEPGLAGRVHGLVARGGEEGVDGTVQGERGGVAVGVGGAHDVGVVAGHVAGDGREGVAAVVSIGAVFAVFAVGAIRAVGAVRAVGAGAGSGVGRLVGAGRGEADGQHGQKEEAGLGGHGVSSGGRVTDRPHSGGC